MLIAINMKIYYSEYFRSCINNCY